MTTLTTARAVAVLVAIGTLGFLAAAGNLRTDNAFLVPDLVTCAVLLVAAVLPDRRAVPALLFGFGATAGVLGASVAHYAVDGRLGAGSLVGALTAAVMAALLARRTRAATPVGG